MVGGRGWQGPLSSPVRDRDNRPNPPLEPPSQDNFCCSRALRVSPAPGFAGWTRDAPARCPPHALPCPGHKAPLQPEGLQADVAAFPALLHHYHESVCINTTALSASVLQTHLHRYHSAVGIAPADPSAPSCQAPACGVGGVTLGTPRPSLPSSVPRGAAWAGEWVAGSCCGRWSAGPDHGTARNEGRVCVSRGGPFAGAACELVPAGPQHAPARPGHGSQRASRGGCG